MPENKPGLWANIHAKRKRIARGSGERMRKPGEEGAPSRKDLIKSRVKEKLSKSSAVLPYVAGLGGLAGASSISAAIDAEKGERTTGVASDIFGGLVGYTVGKHKVGTSRPIVQALLSSAIGAAAGVGLKSTRDLVSGNLTSRRKD